MAELTLVDVASAIITGVATVLSALITVFLVRKNKDRANYMTMTRHVIFDRLNSHIRRVETEFSLDNKGKELIWKDVLKHKFKIWKKCLYKLAEETDACMKNCNRKHNGCEIFYMRNMKYFNEAMYKFDNYYRNTDYTTDEQNALDITIGKFKIWDEQRIRFIEDRIVEISNDSLAYGTCYHKQIAILDSILYVMSDVFQDSQKTIKDINGDLSGLIFKGVEI